MSPSRAPRRPPRPFRSRSPAKARNVSVWFSVRIVSNSSPFVPSVPVAGAGASPIAGRSASASAASISARSMRLRCRAVADLGFAPAAQSRKFFAHESLGVTGIVDAAVADEVCASTPSASRSASPQPRISRRASAWRFFGAGAEPHERSECLLGCLDLLFPYFIPGRIPCGVFRRGLRAPRCPYIPPRRAGGASARPSVRYISK